MVVLQEWRGEKDVFVEAVAAGMRSDAEATHVIGRAPVLSMTSSTTSRLSPYHCLSGAATTTPLLPTNQPRHYRKHVRR